MFSVYPLLREFLAGTTASGLYEARLGYEHFGGETHVLSPAYRPEEFEELLTMWNDFVFNSPAQLRRFGARAKQAGSPSVCASTQNVPAQEGHEIYDPCSGSRPARHWQTLTQHFCPCWTVCTSINATRNKIPTRWRSPYRRLKKSLAAIYPNSKTDQPRRRASHYTRQIL